MADGDAYTQMVRIFHQDKLLPVNADEQSSWVGEEEGVRDEGVEGQVMGGWGWGRGREILSQGR